MSVTDSEANFRARTQALGLENNLVEKFVSAGINSLESLLSRAVMFQVLVRTLRLLMQSRLSLTVTHLWGNLQRSGGFITKHMLCLRQS